MSNPKSISELVPLDVSGRNAKRGFAYQDHVGARFCLEMLEDEELIGVWVEREDDITLIRNESTLTVEFCQVKHNEERTSSWSIPNIAHRDIKSDGRGKSLVEKSLCQDRCLEKTKFRIISSYSIVQDLKCLKSKIGTPERNAEKKKRNAIIEQLVERLGDIKSPNNNDFEYWIENCLWQKLPESIEDLKNNNIRILERILKSRTIELPYRHRDELYQKILALVYEASHCNLTNDPEGYKITYTEFEIWIKETTQELKFAISGDKLTEKLNNAGIDQTIINAAKKIKYYFKSQRLDSDYVRASNLSEFEEDINEQLLELILDLDSGKIDESGVDFMRRCNKLIAYITSMEIHKGNKMSTKLGKGIMYDLTSKCFHRFIKAKS